MEQEKIKLLMKNIGFSDWETTAYLVLVKFGPQSAVSLSRLSKIARSKTYEVMTRLRRKGFIMKVPAMPTKGVTQRFVAIDPKKIFQSKLHDMEDLSETLGKMYINSSIPGFPKINMYTSKEAVKELFFEISNNSKYFYIYLTDLNLQNVLEYSFDHIFNLIKKKKNYFLLRDNEDLKGFSKELKNFSIIKCEENMSFIITEDRVILDLYKSQHVIIEIVSIEAVKTFRDLYNGRSKGKF